MEQTFSLKFSIESSKLYNELEYPKNFYAILNFDGKSNKIEFNADLAQLDCDSLVIRTTTEEMKSKFKECPVTITIIKTMNDEDYDYCEGRIYFDEKFTFDLIEERVCFKDTKLLEKETENVVGIITLCLAIKRDPAVTCNDPEKVAACLSSPSIKELLESFFKEFHAKIQTNKENNADCNVSPDDTDFKLKSELELKNICAGTSINREYDLVCDQIKNLKRTCSWCKGTMKSFINTPEVSQDVKTEFQCSGIWRKTLCDKEKTDKPKKEKVKHKKHCNNCCCSEMCKKCQNNRFNACLMDTNTKLPKKKVCNAMKSSYTNKYCNRYPSDSQRHRSCSDSCSLVPKNMGWQWKIDSDRVKRGWKPGGILKSTKIHVDILNRLQEDFKKINF